MTSSWLSRTSTRRGAASSPSGSGRWYARRSGGWDEPDDDDVWAGDVDAWASDQDLTDSDGYELDELIDWTITLDRWIEPSRTRAETIATSVDDVEVCSSTPSAALRPYASEYEGYMGNYGNTMDRWYRRCGLVVWPRHRAFTVRAEASPMWALDTLSAHVRAADITGAQELAATVTPFWHAVAVRDERSRLFAKALRIARALDQPALAAMLLKPFPVDKVTRADAPALSALVDWYGEPWGRDLVDVWFAHPQRGSASGGAARAPWVVSLPRLCESLAAAGPTGTATACLLVEGSWRWLRDAVERRRGVSPPSRRNEALAELARPTLGVLESTAVIADAELRDEAVGLLRQQGDDLLPCLVAALRAATVLPQATRTAAGLDDLARHCAGRLDTRLARPPRPDSDWSIDLPASCHCDLCALLGRFLADAARRVFEWPLAQERRRHVHSRLDADELPVRHQTRRTGRPYTLVLTKTEAIFERERQARRRDEADLAWLQSHLAT